ncbi:MAG: hypothetical protein IJA85_06185 [Clostridia bacterium]|nr:hypothetical protein [Clostridia bacterium]
MDLVKYAGIALTVLSFLLLIKQIKPEIAPLVSLSASVIFMTAAAANLLPTVEFLAGYADGAMGDYYSYLLKALGIGMIVQTAADICTDAGEGALASKIELLGRAELLLLALPLLKELLTTAEGMIK